MDNLVITCDGIIEVEVKSNNEETKTVLTNFNEKKQPVKQKVSMFYLHFQ